MTGNQQDLARYLGVNKSTVSRAVGAGRIKPEADGTFDFEKCAAAWHAARGGRIDVAARHAQNRGADIPKGQPQPENAPEAEIKTSKADSDIGGRATAKAQGMHWENQSIKLEMSRRMGKRIDKIDVNREVSKFAAMVRGGAERINDQSAPRIATVSAAQQLQILIREALRLSRNLDREMPRSLRRMKHAGQKVGAGGTAE